MNKNNKKGQKVFENRTVATMFQNSKFGEGALKSSPLNDEQLALLTEKAVTGGSFVLRPGRTRDGEPVVTKNGDQIYFLEVLDPYNPQGANSDI